MTRSALTGGTRGTRGPVAVAAVVGLVIAAGCGRTPGPPRYPVTGSVTYAGQPLPAGRISFEPDTEKGNKGPGGYGDIVAGRYSTYRTMGAVGGPHRVVIEGYSGTSPEQWKKRRPLFPAHVTTIDLPLERTTADFAVPAAAERAEAPAR